MREALIKLCSEDVLINVPRFGYRVVRMTEKQVKQAEAKQNTDVWEVWEDNEEFHLLLASFSGNKVLMKLLKDCMGILQRTYAQQRWNSWSSMVDSVNGTPHREICCCIEARDLAGTMELLRKDIEGCSEEN